MATEPPDAQDRETEAQKDGRRFFGKWFHNPQYRSMIEVLAVLLVAAALAVYLWTSGGGPDRPATAAPATGVACQALREAFEQNRAGNKVAARQSVDVAARAGEQALDQSGQVFGQPEKIAIELRYLLATESDRGRSQAARYLAQARQACERLGRWSGSDRD
jgi:uncharacterized membrane protein YccC